MKARRYTKMIIYDNKTFSLITLKNNKINKYTAAKEINYVIYHYYLLRYASEIIARNHEIFFHS